MVRYLRSGAVLIGVALSVVLGGCGSTGGIGSVYQADAFGAKKTYAVVTVMANDKVGCSDLGGNPCNGGVIGLVNTVARTNAYSEDAGDVLETTYPKALQALRGSPNLRLAPEVKANKVYRSAAPDEAPRMMGVGYTLAKGYKYFSEEKMRKLAADLKVDGVIVVSLSYTAARAGMTVGGFGGGHQARVTMTVRAVDREGKKVWSDHTSSVSEGKVGTVSGAVDFASLRPLFVEATDKAAKKLMESFEQKVSKT